MSHPSIFNDVLGPVMRGPSSSHCAAANRIGLLARELMGGSVDNVVISFDTNGSLATTHESQGSDMGLFGGLMGWDCTDERIVTSPKTFRAAAEVQFIIDRFGFEHPNTYHLTLSNSDTRHTLVAISTGGGMIDLVSVDSFPISTFGDSHNTLIFMAQRDDDLDQILNPLNCTCSYSDGPSGVCAHIKSLEPLNSEVLKSLSASGSVTALACLSPVLPVLTPDNMVLPFSTAEEMVAYVEDNEIALDELAIIYESARGNISKSLVVQQMTELIKIWRESIKIGLGGTEYDDRILGSQSPTFLALSKAGKLVDTGALNLIIAYVSSLMEVKSSMGLVIAAPTAGACGTLAGSLVGLADHMGLDDEAVARGMLAAGLIGVFIAERSTFAAEVGGCQAETGSAAGMAAAGIVQMMGGTRKQAIAGASMALQNSLGLICDPVANRVEVPCLGKNIMAASNAMATANMALANFDPVITLDEVIATMDAVGKSMPHELRCTALGGLAITPTSKRLTRELDEKKRHAELE